MPKILVRCTFLATALVATTLFAENSATQSAALPPSPFEGAAFSMSASSIRSASASMPADKASDATILYDESSFSISSANTLNLVHRVVYRIETQNGVAGWAEASMAWDPWYQNASQIHARVLQTDNSFVVLDQKTITDSPVNSDEAETYTSARIRKAPLPGISVGSIVEEVVAVEEKRPYFPNGSVYRYSFISSVPTERQRVIVELPLALPFHESVTDSPQINIHRSEVSGIRHIVYEKGYQLATINGDIDLPSTSKPWQFLEFSTGTTWAGVAQGYAALSDPSIQTDQVSSLLPSIPEANRLATIQLLVQRLHKEVRYTGVEFNEAQLIPQQPAAVLNRHYGDCKDKATLLVTMLRAVHIPAYVALLSSGTQKDINPDLPGMNRFNHAIVYVPASKKDPALWIDATAQFYQVGVLPYEDAGRLALVIAPQTKGLIKTPDPVPQDSVLTETRTFTLADLGPSQVVETSETSGTIDAAYRSYYGGPTSKSIRNGLENFGKSAYLSNSLVKIEHSEGDDLTKPFHMTLTFDGARRGFTTLDDAVVVIFPTATLYSLPKWITTPAVPLPEDATAQQKEDRARQEEQRSPTYNLRPFIAEERYRILVPAGFTLRGLPPDATTPLGPASLTEHYAQESPGVVTATLHFTTGKSVITAQEALDFRQAVTTFSKRPYIEIAFEQNGVKLLAQGKVKAALAADQNTIAQNPGSALPHVRLARALLEVGVGDMARKEAAQATTIDPKSPAALITQGWVLQHGLLGNRFGSGFDHAGAIAAYRKAIPVRTEDFDPRFDLAVLSEYDDTGVRYSPNANLPDAIALYQTLIAEDVQKNSSELSQHRINLGYALLFHHDYQQVEALLPDIPPGISHSVLAITAAVAQKDVAAGLVATEQLNLSADDRSKALLAAGDVLAQLGLYPQVSGILAAGIQGGSDAPTTARRIELFRNLHRVPLEFPPVTTPESAVFAYLNLSTGGKADHTSLAALISHHAYASDAGFNMDIRKKLEAAGSFHVSAQNAQTSDMVLRDVVLGTMTLKSTGSDATGYRVLRQTTGEEASHIFVVREDDTYRIVDDGRAVGHFALYALDHHQPALAKSILDWQRDLLHKGGGDDPFSGSLMPRFWTVDSMRPDADSPEAMRLAAISLLAGSMDIKPYMDQVVAARAQATGSRQVDLDLLLAYGYADSEQPAPALHSIDELLKEEPDSITALSLAGMAYALTGNTASWKALLAPRLTRRPSDPELLGQQMGLLLAQHDYAGARLDEKAIFDSGKATDNDYNNYAWLGLFDDDLGPDITKAAQQANMMSNNRSFADLHTMACVYAAQGKVTEARQVLAQAMTVSELARPDSSVWYALGLLYEDYGLSDAALAAYNRVEAHEWDDHTYIPSESTYILAQKRIAFLTAALPVASHSTK